MRGAARDAITRMHVPPGWLQSLEAIYARSTQLPPINTSRMLRGDFIERPFFGEPDCRHEEMFRSDYPLSGPLRGYMGMVSMKQRWTYRQELRRQGAFEDWWQLSTCLLPEWFKRAVKNDRRPGCEIANLQLRIRELLWRTACWQLDASRRRCQVCASVVSTVESTD